VGKGEKGSYFIFSTDDRFVPLASVGCLYGKERGRKGKEKKGGIFPSIFFRLLSDSIIVFRNKRKKKKKKGKKKKATTYSSSKINFGLRRVTVIRGEKEGERKEKKRLSSLTINFRSPTSYARHERLLRPNNFVGGRRKEKKEKKGKTRLYLFRQRNTKCSARAIRAGTGEWEGGGREERGLVFILNLIRRQPSD